jgi:hypothetical protein
VAVMRATATSVHLTDHMTTRPATLQVFAGRPTFRQVLAKGRPSRRSALC